MSDIVVDALTSDSDVEVVGKGCAREDLAFEAGRLAVDIIILDRRAQEAPDAFAALLALRPGLKVLSIVGDGRSAFLFALCPREVQLGELSPAGLRDAVRGGTAALGLAEDPVMRELAMSGRQDS